MLRDYARRKLLSALLLYCFYVICFGSIADQRARYKIAGIKLMWLLYFSFLVHKHRVVVLGERLAKGNNSAWTRHHRRLGAERSNLVSRHFYFKKRKTEKKIQFLSATIIAVGPSLVPLKFAFIFDIIKIFRSIYSNFFKKYLWDLNKSILLGFLCININIGSSMIIL